MTFILHFSCSALAACPAMYTWPILQEQPPGASAGAGKNGMGSAAIGQF